MVFFFIKCDGTQLTNPVSIYPWIFPRTVGDETLHGDPITSRDSPLAVELLPDVYKVEMNDGKVGSNWYISGSMQDLYASWAIISGSYITSSNGFCYVNFKEVNARDLPLANRVIRIKPVNKNVGFGSYLVSENWVEYVTDESGSVTVPLVPQLYDVTFQHGCNGYQDENYKLLIPPSASVSASHCRAVTCNVSKNIPLNKTSVVGYDADTANAILLHKNEQASSSLSASYASTASVVLGSITSASFAVSASYAPSLPSVSASYALTASFALNGGGSSLTTGSTYPITSSWANGVSGSVYGIGTMQGNGIIASHPQSASNGVGLVAYSDDALAACLTVAAFNSSFLYDQNGGFSIQAVPRGNVLSGLAPGGGALKFRIISGSGDVNIQNRLAINGGVQVNALDVGGNISASVVTASVFTGTANNSISSSYAQTASVLLGSITSASYALSASYAPGSPSISASYAGTASVLLGAITSASYALSASYAPSNPVASASYSSTSSLANVARSVVATNGSSIVYDTGQNTWIANVGIDLAAGGVYDGESGVMAIQVNEDGHLLNNINGLTTLDFNNNQLLGEWSGSITLAKTASFVTASNVKGTVTSASFSQNSNNAASSSFANNALTASVAVSVSTVPTELNDPVNGVIAVQCADDHLLNDQFGNPVLYFATPPTMHGTWNGTVTNAISSLTASITQTVTPVGWIALNTGSAVTWSVANNVYEDRRTLELKQNCTMSIQGLYDGWAGILKITNNPSGSIFISPTPKVLNGTGSLTQTSGSTDFIGLEYSDNTLWAAYGNNFR